MKGKELGLSNKAMKDMGSWKVREGNRLDVEGILSLRGVVFAEEERDKLDSRFWQWEFVDGPAGKAFIYIVEDGNRIIGHFADIPRQFSVQTTGVLGTLSLDLMVHPDYWRRGIFAATGRYGAEKVRQENGLFLTAFPIRSENHPRVEKDWLERSGETSGPGIPDQIQGHSEPIRAFSTPGVIDGRDRKAFPFSPL